MNTFNEIEIEMGFINVYQNHYGPITGYRIRPNSELVGPLDIIKILLSLRTILTSVGTDEG